MTDTSSILPRKDALAAIRHEFQHPEDEGTSSQWFTAEPNWFKRATFYEIHIRGFADGNDDGIGDFRGLTERLDYLQWLGIDCIWLLSMFASPLRGGGTGPHGFQTR